MRRNDQRNREISLSRVARMPKAHTRVFDALWRNAGCGTRRLCDPLTPDFAYAASGLRCRDVRSAQRDAYQPPRGGDLAVSLAASAQPGRLARVGTGRARRGAALEQA